MAFGNWGLGRIGACAAALLAAMAAMAGGAAAQDDKTVYFLTWGGTVQQFLEKEGWNQKFTAATGYKVVLVPKATGPEIIAAAIAQKDKPQVDVVQTDLLPFLAGNDQGIFVPIDAKEIPNIDKLVDAAKFNPNGIMTYGDVFSLIYNHETFKKKGWAPPKAEWSELTRPEFKGAMVLPPANTTYGLYVMIILARLNGGNENNIDPGVKALKALAPGIVEWPTTFARMGQFLEDGSAAVGFYTSSTAAELGKRGIPVSYVTPKPVMFTGTAAGIMKNAPNPQGARAFLNWWLSTEVQQARAQGYGNTVMNKEVTGNPIPAAELAKMEKIDYDVVNKARPEWIKVFEREIAPK
ncbi:MAG: extracellular solute-binding protein [Alphaproteobacteria bacterium]|nr:extracellular solute-binding protein [Alphaproteobacteria bacterium]